MNIQGIIDSAVNANVTTIAINEATKTFRSAYNGSIVVSENLTKRQRMILERITDLPLVFRPSKSAMTDHMIIAALRNIVRIGYESAFKIKHTKINSLVIGSTAREINCYWENPYVKYYVYGREAKDFDRLISPCITLILEKVNKKVTVPMSKIATHGLLALKHYNDMKMVLQDTGNLLNRVISTDLCEANQLIFEDTIYNFNKDELYDLFKKTNASIGYGYALLPYDLIFKDMPEQNLYSYSEFEEYGKMFGRLTWRHGSSTGYVHELDKWRTLLLNPVIEGEDFSLVIELCKFVGPMCYFKIMKTKCPERITRCIELPEHMKYVKVLDLHDSFDRFSNTLCKRSYFSVYESDFLDCVTYLMACDPATLTIQNTVAYVRKRVGGIPMLGTELLRPWGIPANRIYSFSLSCLMYAIFEVYKTRNLISSLQSHGTGFMAWIKKNFTSIFTTTFAKIIEYLFGKKLTESIIVYPDLNGRLDQYYRIGPCRVFEKPIGVPEIDVDISIEPEIDDSKFCHFCNDYIKLPQTVDCKHLDKSEHTWTLTLEEITTLRERLSDNEEDTDMKVKIMKIALENIPLTAIRHKTRVHYVCGGPGTGKSEIIRCMADASTLIVGPFHRLKSDYCNHKDANGDKLHFKTQHTALAERNKSVIMVDEFSSYPYELLAILAYVTSAEDIWLFGDHRQCKVLEYMQEGIYIGNKINLESVDKHELLTNFRLPRDAIARLNKEYGYRMVPWEKTPNNDSIIAVDNTDDKYMKFIMEAPDITKLFFSKDKSIQVLGNDKFTIRKFQGATKTKTAIFLDGKLPSLMNIDSLQIVMISRHTEICYLVNDGSSYAKNLCDKLATTPLWKEHLESFIKFPDTNTHATALGVVETEPLDIIPKPTFDAYKNLELLVPTIALDPEVVALNELQRNVVVGTMQKSITNVANLFGISNAGKPVNLQQTYRCIGPGMGLQFNSKAPWQELSVLSRRYDGPRRKFDFNSSQYQQVTDMVDEYYQECKDMSKFNFDEYHLNEMVNKFLLDIKTKNYLSQVEKQLITHLDIETIRFNLKASFKPESLEKGLNLYKAGQGISAWSTYLASMFCLAFRFIQFIDQQTNRNDEDCAVLTDNGLDELEFFKLVEDAQKNVFRYNEPVKNGTSDGVQFDSCQNQFTQNIERQYLTRLGVDDSFLNLYYSFRSHSPIIGNYFKSTLGYEKTSGEPGTLINNGIVSKVCSNYILRGKGKVITMYKGDDFNKMQMGLEVNLERKKWVNDCCDIQFKFWIRETGEFCGLLVTPEGLVPNIMRRVIKLTGRRWRDYNHFTEYQQSLRDYISLINNIGISKALAGTMMAYDTTYDVAVLAYDCLVSWTHINEEQWLKYTTLKTDNLSIPTYMQNDKNNTMINIMDDVPPLIPEEFEQCLTYVNNEFKSISDSTLSRNIDNHIQNLDVSSDVVTTPLHECPRIFGLQCNVCDSISEQIISNSKSISDNYRSVQWADYSSDDDEVEIKLDGRKKKDVSILPNEKVYKYCYNNDSDVSQSESENE